MGEAEKGRRLERLIAEQQARSLRINQRMIGRTTEVLVESTPKKQPDWLAGQERAVQDRRVRAGRRAARRARHRARRSRHVPDAERPRSAARPDGPPLRTSPEHPYALRRQRSSSCEAIAALCRVRQRHRRPAGRRALQRPRGTVLVRARVLDRAAAPLAPQRLDTAGAARAGATSASPSASTTSCTSRYCSRTSRFGQGPGSRRAPRAGWLGYVLAARDDGHVERRRRARPRRDELEAPAPHGTVVPVDRLPADLLVAPRGQGAERGRRHRRVRRLHLACVLAMAVLRVRRFRVSDAIDRRTLRDAPRARPPRSAAILRSAAKRIGHAVRPERFLSRNPSGISRESRLLGSRLDVALVVASTR